MKDAYSFDRDEEGSTRPTQHQREAYDAIFDRCGLEWYECESDVGMMGGTGAHEYMAPCAAGENDVVLAPGLQRQHRGRERRPAARAARDRARAASCTRPGRRRSPPSPAASACTRGNVLKAFPVIVRVARAGHGLRARRPSRQRDQARQRARRAPFRPAQDDELRGPGRLPRAHGPDVDAVYDDAIVAGRLRSSGANRPDHHLVASTVDGGERVDVRTVEAGRHGRRRPDPHRAGDRDRQHLQARHALQRAACGRPTSTRTARSS